MVKTLSSEIKDARPRIKISLASDDDKTLVQVSNTFVNVQRGPKTAILRVPVGELSGAIDTLVAAKAALEKNGYDTTSGSEEPLAAPTTRAKHVDTAQAEQVVPAEQADGSPVAQANPFVPQSA